MSAALAGPGLLVFRPSRMVSRGATDGAGTSALSAGGAGGGGWTTWAGGEVRTANAHKAICMRDSVERVHPRDARARSDLHQKAKGPLPEALADSASRRLAAYALFLFAATFTFATRFRAFFGCIEGWKRYSGSPIESFRWAGAGCLYT